MSFMGVRQRRLWLSGMSYLLRDEFGGELAAGSVNGTLSTSGHTRTVTDTESKISITGGALTFSGGKAVAELGDPAFWINSAVVRLPGRIMIKELTFPATNKSMYMGFDSNTIKGSMSPNLNFYSDGYIYNNSSTKTMAYSATSYQCTIAMRASGSMKFIKGGAFTNWTLLYIDTAINTSPMYASIQNQSAAFTSSYLRIPSQLWLPSPLLSDSFNRADGALGTSDGAGHAESTGLGSGGGGLAWSDGTVSSNAAVITPTEGTSLWDAAASTFESGTYSWTAVGSNTVTNDSSTLKITYVDNVVGAIDYLRDAKDLSSDLTIGTWYSFTCDSKVGSGNSVKLSVAAASSPFTAVTRTSFGTDLITFRASNATTNYAYVYSLDAGEIVWLDNISLKPMTLSSLFTCPTTPFSTADVIATATISAYTIGTQAGIVTNLDSLTSPTALVIAYLDGAGNANVDELAGGVWTNKISGAVTYGAAKELRVVRDGTYCALYYDNALVGSVSTMTANTNKYHGLFSTYSGNKFDNFCVYARGTSGEYLQLEKY